MEIESLIENSVAKHCDYCVFQQAVAGSMQEGGCSM